VLPRREVIRARSVQQRYPVFAPDDGVWADAFQSLRQLSLALATFRLKSQSALRDCALNVPSNELIPLSMNFPGRPKSSWSAMGQGHRR